MFSQMRASLGSPGLAKMVFLPLKAHPFDSEKSKSYCFNRYAQRKTNFPASNFFQI